MHGPRIVTASDDVHEGKVRVAVEGVQEPKNAVDDEKSQVVIMTRERLGIHGGPVDIFDEIVEKAAPVVGEEIVPYIIDMRHRGIGALIISDRETARRWGLCLPQGLERP